MRRRRLRLRLKDAARWLDVRRRWANESSTKGDRQERDLVNPHTAWDMTKACALRGIFPPPLSSRVWVKKSRDKLEVFCWSEARQGRARAWLGWLCDSAADGGSADLEGGTCVRLDRVRSPP